MRGAVTALPANRWFLGEIHKIPVLSRLRYPQGNLTRTFGRHFVYHV